MTEEEVKALVERYDRDSTVTYELTSEELDVLLTERGELEPIVDAINVLCNASLEQRASDIGCDVMDFLCDIQRGIIV